MRATRQPRVTDAVELASTPAVSSIDRPPKNRSPTTRIELHAAARRCAVRCDESADTSADAA